MLEALLCSCNAVVFLPLIANRHEAECILTVSILGKQLDSSIRCLMINAELEMQLQIAMSQSAVSTNVLDTVLTLSLSDALASLRKRNQCNRELINTLLEELSRVSASIKQYGFQNYALVKELEQFGEISTQKRLLASIEMELVEKIQKVISMACEKDTSENLDVIIQLCRKGGGGLNNGDRDIADGGIDDNDGSAFVRGAGGRRRRVEANSDREELRPIHVPPAPPVRVQKLEQQEAEDGEEKTPTSLLASSVVVNNWQDTNISSSSESEDHFHHPQQHRKEDLSVKFGWAARREEGGSREDEDVDEEEREEKNDMGE